MRAAIGAWQPLTGHGIAAFAGASGSRLLLFQTVLALALALTFSWTGRRIATIPVRSALGGLPDELAGISGGRLQWPGTDPVLLAQGPHLALVVDPNATGDLGLNSDIQLELRERSLTFRGVLGQTPFSYPDGLEIPLDRTGAAATWGAWQLPLLVFLTAAGFTCVLATWWILAALYSFPAWALAWVIRRPIRWTASWRLCCAALLPAALLPGAGLLLYATLWIRLPGLIGIWLLHFPAGWAWLIWGIISLPPGPARNPNGPANPFVPGGSTTKGARSGSSRRARDPFSA